MAGVSGSGVPASRLAGHTGGLYRWAGLATASMALLPDSASTGRLNGRISEVRASIGKKAKGFDTIWTSAGAPSGGVGQGDSDCPEQWQ